MRLHAHLVHAQVQCGRQQLNADRRKRIVAPEVEALVIVVPLRDDGIVFQRRAGEAVHVQMVDVDDVRGFGESLLDVAVLEDATPDDVGPHCVVKNRAIGGRDLGVNHGLERLVVDAHQFGGVFRDGRSFGDDGGDRLALVASTINCHGVVKDLVAGRRTDLEEWIDELADLLTGKCADHTGQRLGFGNINAGDFRMRVRRAHEHEVQHAEQLDVVDKLPLAADQARVFLALDGLADPISGLIMRCGRHAFPGPGLKPLCRTFPSSPG